MLIHNIKITVVVTFYNAKPHGTVQTVCALVVCVCETLRQNQHSTTDRLTNFLKNCHLTPVRCIPTSHPTPTVRASTPSDIFYMAVITLRQNVQNLEPRLINFAGMKPNHPSSLRPPHQRATGGTSQEHQARGGITLKSSPHGTRVCWFFPSFSSSRLLLPFFPRVLSIYLSSYIAS